MSFFRIATCLKLISYSIINYMQNIKQFAVILLIFSFFISQTMLLALPANTIELILGLDKRITNIQNKNNNEQMSTLNIIKILKSKITLLNGSQYNTKLQALPSLTYSKKASSSFSFIYRIGYNNYYSVDGELLVSYDYCDKQHFYYGIRNQFSYFAQISTSGINKKIQIRKLKNLGNRFLTESICQIQHQTQFQYTQFISTSSAGIKYFIFVAGSQHVLQVFDKNCKYVKIVNMTIANPKKRTLKSFVKEQKSLVRVNNDFIVYCSNEIAILSIGMDKDRMQKCSLIREQIMEIKSDENNLNIFYVLTLNKLYEYQISPYCKVVNYYYIPSNASIYSVGKSLFVMSKDFNYYFDKTNPSPKNLQLPQSFNNNSLNGKQIIINKKNHNSYMISSIDYVKDHNSSYYSIEIFSLGTQSQQIVQDAGFSKVRIPLILCSFCLIAYLTFRKKNQQKAQEQETFKTEKSDRMTKIFKQKGISASQN